MKIIFSRKGFDSGYGGIPSPILPDGTILSMPIPNEEDHIGYQQLVLPNERKTYWRVLRELLRNKKLQKGKTKIPLNKHRDYHCHFDPDLRRDALRKGRGKGWLPSLGQIGAAQGHLRKQGIQEGDLFLFFGWYQFTELRNEKLCYDEDRYIGGFHMFFGYLQVGNILKSKAIQTRAPSWLKEHPHYRLERRREDKNNAIYVAAQKLSWNKDLPGGGTFKFHNDSLLSGEILDLVVIVFSK
ncbi:MAG: hypothetical protein ACE5G9_09675, partial [Nitrospinales bacterium]